MKKIILLISLILLGFVAQSQTAGRTRATLNVSSLGYLSYPLTTAASTATLTDSLKTVADSILYVFAVQDCHPFKFSVGASCLAKSAVTDTAKFHICVYGQQFTGGTWTKIGTSGVYSAAVASATTQVFAQFDYGTAVQYRYISVHISKTTSKASTAGWYVKDMELKVYYP